MLKKIFCWIIFLCFVSCVWAAQPLTQAQINKINKDIVRLKAKLKKVPANSKQAYALLDLIEGQEARLKPKPKIPKPLENKTAIIEPIGPIDSSIEVVSVNLNEEKKTIGLARNIKVDLGIAGGSFSSASGLNLEMRLQTPYVMGPATTSLRLAGGYYLSRDMDRRYALIQTDAMLNSPAGMITGVENYFGFGLNYVAMTTGRVSGALGGQVFYGVEGDGFAGTMFGEIGYGIMRTGFSPSHKGITLLVGFHDTIFE